ncbi:MAG: hypothetical protein JETT_1706 [Candidatus Jettenia ecosi]|uniref:Uncharacterized protein n=1 Tax=Candidatus Jettenia ecosi TaxID=2494326 RepID=A0A533QBA3_9BACT|nr:MAG: hypothetical protein JETT_1706 [Candidatus Jettenia ecosi]
MKGQKAICRKLSQPQEQSQKLSKALQITSSGVFPDIPACFLLFPCLICHSHPPFVIPECLYRKSSAFPVSFLYWIPDKLVLMKMGNGEWESSPVSFAIFFRC